MLACRLEDRWTKDQILGAYLNTIYFGDGAYGIEAAARTYFHKHASALNIKEAALLAALPKFPSAYSPTTDKEMAKEQRNKVLQLMADQGYVTQEHADKLMASSLHVYKHPPNYNKSLADYFVSYVTKELTKRYGSAMVFDGGLKVITSIDVEWQQRGDRHHQVDHRTARLRVQAVGRARGRRSGQRLHPHHGRRPRLQEAAVQPGHAGEAAAGFRDEALRAVTTAVEQGMNPDTTYYSSKSPIIIPMGAYAEPWLVNGDGPGGPESVSAATTISDNVVFAQLSVDVGPDNTVDTAHRMGITSPLDAVPSITLGTSGVTPLEMADAYATLAAGGIRHKPQAIVRVERRGKVIWKPTTKGKRAIPRRRRQRRHPVPRARRLGRHRLRDRRLLPVSARRQDGHHRRRSRPLVLRLHARTSRPPSGWATTTSARPCPCSAATTRAPMWGKFFAAALKDQPHPSFKTYPWSFSPWEGKMQAMSPSASASPSESASGKPSPGPTKTITPAPEPTKTKPPTPQPTPTKTKTPKPTPTPTGTPSAGPKQVVAATLSPVWSRSFAAARVTTAGAGSGDAGVAGDVVHWLAGILGL